MANFDIITSLAIIILAAVVHASFQLSISVLTLLSGHSLGRKTAHRRIFHLTMSYILGAATMTVLLLCTFAMIIGSVLPYDTPLLIWAISCGAMVGVGISVWLFYYRQPRGTVLWIPRGFAQFLSDRTKASKSTAETFGLGLTSVFAEILFIFAPILVASLVLIRLSPDLQLFSIALYVGVSLLPLLVVGLLVGRGRQLSRIQRWRESNKRFLQFAAGAGLLVLGAFVYIQTIVVTSVSALGGGSL